MNWDWTEATYEEFEKRRMTENYYRLFYVDGNIIPYNHGDRYDVKTYTLYKFWAKNDNEAKAIRDEYESTHSGNIKVFYGASNYYHRYDDNGNIIMSDSVFHSESDNENRVIDYIMTKWFRFKDFMDNVRGFCKSLWYFVRHYDFKTWRSFQYNDAWNVDSSVLSLLENSIERLKNDSHSYPNWCGDDEKTAVTKWHAELDKLLLEIRLYNYCVGYGIIDKNDKVMSEIDRKYHNIIPYVLGTFNDIDYAKLYEITQDHWRAIWTQWEKIGQNCWD